MSFRERLDELYRRLGLLPAFSSHDEALAAISRVLTEVEDGFPGVPRDPTDTPTDTKGPHVSAASFLRDR
jgi:hypothetical protein